MLSHARFIIAAIGVGIFSLNGAAAAQPARAVDFNRDIRPILSDNCFACHGPDQAKRKAKLRLDEREAAIQSEAFVPGKPDESELVRRIFTSDEDDLMPPPESNKKLTPAQKELLKKWIAGGAEYASHWAYLPPKRAELPTVKEQLWVRNPIDAFILQALEARSIKPSPEADKRALLRRLSLDLTGLPPTPAEVQSFLDDKDARAYEKQVERLLKSPHFGERMAVPWLDTARYADTVGYHGDQNQNIFPYRDYVIAAFNQNKPFDQFTIEQLAGDLLPNPTAEQRVATGFNRLNMVTREGGAQPKEYLAKYAADRVRTVSSTWLGSTMGCAECHDHKFDPFSAKDFYSLGAFFADVKQWGVYSDYKYTPNPDLKNWSNDHPFPPELEVESDYLKRREARLRQRLADLVAATTAKLGGNAPAKAAFAKWRTGSLAFLQGAPGGWITPTPSVAIAPPPPKAGKPAPKRKPVTAGQKAAEAAKNSLTNAPVAAIEPKPEAKAEAKPEEAPKPPAPEFFVEADGRVVFTNKGAANLQIKLSPSAGGLAAVRLELLPHEKHGGGFLRGGAKSTTVKLAAAWQKKGRTNETKLAFRHADADHKEPRFANGMEVIGVRDGWKTAAQITNQPQTSVWLLDQPVTLAEGDTLTLKLEESVVGCVRVSLSPFAHGQPLAAGWIEPLRATLDAKDSFKRSFVAEAFLASTAADAPAFVQYKTLNTDLLECRNGRAMTLVTVAMNPLTMRVLPRGNWQDENGEVVSPNPPRFLAQPANAEGRRLNRLDLARWLVAAENPLTARVFVNRLWKQYFGAGLCNTVDDFGAQGESPSHPELLDWLAVEFRDHGWDVKQIVRLMVTSATYRQDANLRRELRDLDPNNRLLASQNPRRLEAEFVRDNALFIAGQLNLEVGGPSAKPYQPPGYYANLQFPDRNYAADKDERQYRRGVYSHWQRTFLHPMLANFDAPSREECTANRTVSNTPQQALTLLNDPSFVEAARLLAHRALALAARSDEAKLNFLFEAALARPARAKEMESLKQFLAEQRVYYRANAEDTRKLTRVGQAPAASGVEEAELAAWTSVCRVVLNLHETITRY